MIEINFPRISCSACGSNEQFAQLKGSRYIIYCKNCRKFIKWADYNQNVIINARKDWLEEHDKNKDMR